MKIAKIDNGVVTNVIEIDPALRPDWSDGWPDAAGAGPGWSWDGAAFIAPPEPPVPAAEDLLAAERAKMVVTPLQGKLALGEAAWAAVEAWRDTYATWAQRQIIDSALDWHRMSENMQLFGHLLNYTPEQMDALFRAAAQVRA